MEQNTLVLNKILLCSRTWYSLTEAGNGLADCTVSTPSSSSVTSCLVEQFLGHTIYMLLISLDYRVGGVQSLQFCRWIHAMSFLDMSWCQTWASYINSSVFLSIFTRVFVVFDSALSLVARQLQELCWYSYVTIWRRHREMPFEHTLTQVGLYEWFFYCNFVNVRIVYTCKFVDAETENFPAGT